MTDVRARILRRGLRVTGGLLLRLLTRARIEGRQYIDTPGPVIYAGNHMSTFDALLILVLLPTDTVFVGPGDFKLLWPGEWVVRHAGIIRMKRGAVDRDGLKRLMEALKAGGRLAMFPDGGTWEKPIDDVKSGVSYLSHATGARIVPMAFGGTYQVWKRMFRLRFPRVTVRFGPPQPPVSVSADRKRRQDELQAAAVALMRELYAMLPPDTQARYDLLARQQYRGRLAFRPDSIPPPDVSLDALAEMVVKPNLFSPLYWNARLPVRPFARYGRYVPARRMKIAADALQRAFSGGDFDNFLEYRLGNAKAAEIRAALTAISAAMDDAEARGAQVAFIPTVTERAGDDQ
jgi:1-acyl-sn-glycerol-3-phosphate acyltransferase